MQWTMSYTTHRLTPEASDFTPFVVGWSVGWEISIPFQHTNRIYWGQGLE